MVDSVSKGEHSRLTLISVILQLLAMTTERGKTSPTSITNEPFFNDVATNTTPSWHDVDNVTETFQVPEGCLVIPNLAATPVDNPRDLVSAGTARQYLTFVQVYVLTLCFLISAPTNLINMAVFWKHGIKERINLCLFCLSFADLIVIVSYFLMYAEKIYTEISNTDDTRGFLFYFIQNKIQYFPAGFPYVSGFLSTLIAFERCLCVVSPLKEQSVIQTKTAVVVIATGNVVIMAGAYFLVVRFRFVCLFDPFTGKSKDGLYHSDFYLNNRELIDTFVGIVYGIGLPGVYTVSISICTIITVVKLRRMAEWREQSSSSASLSRGMSAVKDATLTRMLVGTSCVFVSCITPHFLFYVIVPFVPELRLGGTYSNTFRVGIATLQMASFINSSVNFFVYYYFGTKYRQTVRGMFCGRRKIRNCVRMTTGKEIGRDSAVFSVSQ